MPLNSPISDRQVAAAQAAMRKLRDVEESMWLTDEEMLDVLLAAWGAQFVVECAGTT